MARRVLIVDDDELVLMALRELLRSEKYEVHTFSRGSAALEKLDQEDFDLLILDIVMPEMDGFELCTQIRERMTATEITPILFLTAKNQEEDIKRGLEVGASLFLSKPISPHKLLAVIKETIG